MANDGGGDAFEPFGTTALPRGTLRVGLNDAKMGEAWFGDNVDGHVVAQQPQTQAFATYEASKNATLDPLAALNGSLIDVNTHFVVYALKNGLIRVLHRQSAMRSLLRGHSGQVVTDITFFKDGDTVATVGNGSDTKSTLIVWRVYERPPEIGSERLLEITNLGYGGAPDLTMTKLVWHPFNPNQFWLTHSSASSKQVATLVETTRIQTKVVQYRDPKDKSPQPQEQHAVCQWHGPHCILENGLQLRDNDAKNDGQLVDLVYSGRDARHVLSVHKNGRIILWDLKATESGAVGGGADDDDESGAGDADKGTIVPKKLFVIEDGDREHSRCIFLPHDQSVELQDSKSNLESITTCFATASATNSTITIWSAFAAVQRSDMQQPRQLVHPTKLQELDIFSPNPSSFVLDICYGPANLDGKPPSSFLMLGSRDTGRLYAFHVKSEWSDTTNGGTKAPLCAGVDYLVPFSLKHPVYSWSVICCATQDVSAGNGDDDDDSGGSGFDIKAFAYQSKAVQCLAVTSNMSLPPNGGSSDSGVVTSEPLMGPYVTAAATGAAGSSPPKEYEPAYEEEEYDIDEDEGDDDAAKTPAAPEPPSAAAAGAAGGGGLFPGAPNPFANWLGAIAGSSAPPPAASGATGDTDEDDEEEEEALPTPPAPSALPMPPGIAPPPGIVGPPPGMVLPAAPEASTSDEPILNPLELLARSMGGIALSEGTNTAVGETTKQTDANNKKNKGRSPNRRSRSPKAPQQSTAKKGSKSNSNKPGPQVQILKRSVAAAPPPLPADPSVLSDPALLAAAGIPIPSPAAVQQQEPPAVAAAVLEEQVQKAVEAAVSGVVVPAIQKSVRETFAQMARPLHNSMDALGRKGVSVDADALKQALDVETPLKAAFADNIRNVVVPSLQSISGQVLQQVQASMPKPPPPAPPQKDDSVKVLTALAQQIQVMTSKLDALTTEVTSLRQTVADQAAAAAAATAAQQKGAAGSSNMAHNTQTAASKQAQAEAELVQIRNQIDVLLSKGKYQEAFTKAVAVPNPSMTIYCCARCDVRVVLTDASPQQPVLSQLILLCLMQQLSAALAGTQSEQEMHIELAWLQEITLAMNMTDPSIVQHVPKVLRQLVSNVNARLGLEGTGPFRRPLQMLLNSLMGMQMALGK